MRRTTTNPYPSEAPAPPVEERAASSPAARPGTRSVMVIVGILTAALLAVELTVLAWATRRGVDVTDEGLYHLEYAHPRPDPYFFSQYDVLVGLVFGPFRPPILGLRVLRLALELATSGVLAYGAVRFVRLRVPTLTHLVPGWLLWLGASVLALASHSWLPETPAYNTFTAALVAAVLGMVLVVCSGASIVATRLLGATVGVAITILLFVKWTTALPMAALVAVVMLVLRGLGPSTRAFGWITLGSAATFLVATSVGPLGGFDPAALRASNESFGAADTHSPSAALSRYLDSVVDHLREVRTGWTAVALVVFIALFVLSQVRLRRAVRATVAAAAPVGILYGCAMQLRGSTAMLGPPSSPSMLLVPMLGLTAGLLVAAGRGLRESPSRARQDRGSGWTDLARRWCPIGLVVAALGATPFLASVGTSNLLLPQTLVAAAPFGILLVLGAATLVRAAPRGALLAGTGLLLALCLVATQTVNGRLFFPYRATTTLAGQTTALSGIPGYEGILIDPDVAAFAAELRSVVADRTSYEPGDPVLVLAKGAGLVSLLDGAPAGPGWLSSPWNDQGPNCWSIERASEELERTTLVLTVDDPVAPDLDQCVERWFTAWPDDVREVAAVAYPFSSAAHQADVVRVYAVP